MAAAPRRWSAHVTETSDALDIPGGTFALEDPKAIARELMRDAEGSHRRKSSPYRSAMSMLTFYINRAGKNLPAARKRVLEAAKDELRASYGTSSTTKNAPAKKTTSRKKTTARKQTRATGAARKRA